MDFMKRHLLRKGGAKKDKGSVSASDYNKIIR